MFQCILASNDLQSFVIFHYADGLFEEMNLDEFNDTEPEPGSGSGFENFNNITVAREAGINAGDGRFESIEGETNISMTSNLDIPGVWMFQTNEQFIIQPSKK